MKSSHLIIRVLTFVKKMHCHLEETGTSQIDVEMKVNFLIKRTLYTVYLRAKGVNNYRTSELKEKVPLKMIF